MAYNQKLADRVCEELLDSAEVEEKLMFGGVCFMVNGKMCIGVVADELMCRIDPEREEEALSKNGCRPMDFNGRPMRGYVFVDESVLKGKKDLVYWVDICLEFNVRAKASKKRAKKNGK